MQFLRNLSKQFNDPIDTHKIPCYPIKYGGFVMALFLSTIVHKIDKKGRVSVPAHFRSALQNQEFLGVVLYKSLHVKALEGCGVDRLQSLSNHYDSLDLSVHLPNDLASFIFAESVMLPFDGEGRILIPRVMLDEVDVKDELAFVGRGKTFEVWNPDVFQQHQSVIRQKVCLERSEK